MEKKTIVARAKVLAEKQAAFLNATEALIQEHFKSFVETIDGMLAEEMVIESF